MANTTITLKLTNEQENLLYKTYIENLSKAPQYAKWQLKVENCVITCYTSGKTVFQGKDAEIYASAFQDIKTSTPTTKSVFPQAGSDEVGTGDYFGSVCVCATIVTEESSNQLQQLGVRDSKALTDTDIRKIAPELIKFLPYSLLLLPNAKYNEVHKTNNINEIKAKMHNQAYVNLSRKYGLPSFMIIDQFAPEKTYYNYLRNEPHVISNIHFETKAEDKYPAVGAASIIARYGFLLAWDEMEKKYDMKFQKGAGSLVDECAAKFIQKYGMDELSNVAKLHFKNTEKAQNL